MRPAPDAVIYGGAFDPPHAGHADCVRLALRALPDASVHVVPTFAPSGGKTTTAGFEDRVAMCRLAFAGDRTTVETWERDLPAPSYTARTLAHVAALMPGKQLGLLVGQDQLPTFHQWHAPAEVLRRATLLVVARREPHAEQDPDALQRDVAAMTRRLGLDASEAEGRVRVLHGDASDAASHEIRHLQARAGTIPVGWLDPAVARYADEHHLYKDLP